MSRRVKKGRAKPYKVGKGKPPRQHQFVRGKSGNPNGRPRGSKNLNSAIERELKRKISITVNGREKKVAKGDLIVTQFVNKAASGDSKAVHEILKRAPPDEDMGDERTDPFAIFDTPDHHLVMAEIVRRIRAADPPPETNSHETTNSSKGES